MRPPAWARRFTRRFIRRRPSVARSQPDGRAKKWVELGLEGDLLRVRGRYARPGWRVFEISGSLRHSEGEVRVRSDEDHDFSARLPLEALRRAAVVADDVVDLWLHLVPEETRPDVADDVPPVRLGGFERTLRTGAPQAAQESSDRIFVTQKGNLSLLLGGAPTRRFEVQVDEFALDGAVAELRFVVRGADRRANAARFVATSRESGARHEFPCMLQDDPQQSALTQGRLVQHGHVVVPLKGLVDRLETRDEILDLFVEVEDADGVVQHKRVHGSGCGRLPRAGRVEQGGAVVQLLPYETFRGANVSVRVERLSVDSFSYLQRWVRAGWLLRLVRPFLGIWLIGEQPYKAQDNGYHLFRWLREHQPHRRAYYVVDESSPDLARLEGLGNVVLRGSRAHVRVALLASRLVGTHHAEYLLPSRHPAAVAAARGVRVFIRHGISGTKNMTANYGRFAPGFRTDRFHVSSDRERRVAIDEFGYRPAQVRVTGLPRFDELLAPLESEPDGLLVIPTWREWLGTRESFLTSEYREQWQQFLTHPRLARAMDAGLRVTFILHPNMRHFVDLFDAPGVRVLRQGEVDVQSLLREHAGLVTDYSSVAFDFAILRRPIVYFQFDQERFFGPHGSFLDLDDDLPGTIVADVDQLVDQVDAAVVCGFTMPAEHWDRAQRAVRYHDRRNCERVARSVQTAGGPEVLGWRWADRWESGRQGPGRAGRS